MSAIPSYPKVWQVGHQAVLGIFDAPVLLQEKVDGSQFSFGILDGVLHCRSKEVAIDVDDSKGMFSPAVKTVRDRSDLLKPGLVYRAEFVGKPKHNTLRYDRTPNDFLVLFDVHLPHDYITPCDPVGEAQRLGLEFVPDFGTQLVTSTDELFSYLERESFLGGCTIEGVVVKRYDMLTSYGQPAFAKYVSEAFKETHRKDWKNRNPSGKEFVELLGSEFASEARFTKAVQRLRDRGELTATPADIGPLMKDLADDLETEWTDEIKARLYEHFRRTVHKHASRGAPEWYKQQLAERAFDGAA